MLQDVYSQFVILSWLKLREIEHRKTNIKKEKKVKTKTENTPQSTARKKSKTPPNR